MRNLILALVFAGSLIAIPLTGPRLPVEIEVRVDEVTFRAGLVEETVPFKSGPVSALRISMPPGVLPVKWKDLSVSTGSGSREQIPVPSVLAPRMATPATGDWWIDRKDAVPEEVLRLPVDLRPPFTLRGELIGRTNGFTRLDLVSESPLSCYFRLGLVNGDLAVRAGEKLMLHEYYYLETARGVRGILSTLLLLLAGASGLALCFRLAGHVFSRWSGQAEAGLLRAISHVRERSGWITMGIILAAFLGELWVASAVLERTPHFQDDLGYLLRAKWLARGISTQPVDGLAPHLDVPFAVRTGGRWFIGYTIGWPALLTLGQFLGAAWVVPAVCGALSLWVLFLLGRNLYGPVTGTLAVTFAALSPLNGILWASPLSHAGTGLLILLSVYFATVSLALSGLFLGLAFCCRPLTAVAIGIPLGVYLLFHAIRARDRREIAGLGAFVLSGLIGTLPVWIDNALTTGRPLLFGLELLGQGQRLSNWPFGLHWMDVSLAQLSPMLFGWLWRPVLSPEIAFAIAGAFLLPFLLRRPDFREWLLLALFVSLVAIHICHKSPGNHGYGPRYYAEAIPFLQLLAAGGFAAAARPAPDSHRSRSALPAAFVVTLLVSSALIAWPRRMALYRGYNDIDASLVAAVEKANIRDGVIVLDPQNYLQWVRAGRVVPASWDDPVVVVGRALDNSALYSKYPNRAFYLWQSGTLRALGKPAEGMRIEDFPAGPFEAVETLEPLLGAP